MFVVSHLKYVLFYIQAVNYKPNIVLWKCVYCCQNFLYHYL